MSIYEVVNAPTQRLEAIGLGNQGRAYLTVALDSVKADMLEVAVVNTYEAKQHVQKMACVLQKLVGRGVTAQEATVKMGGLSNPGVERASDRADRLTPAILAMQADGRAVKEISEALRISCTSVYARVARSRADRRGLNR